MSERLAWFGLGVHGLGVAGVVIVAVLMVDGWPRLVLGASTVLLAAGMLAYQEGMWKKVFALHDRIDALNAVLAERDMELMDARYGQLARELQAEGSARDE